MKKTLTTVDYSQKYGAKMQTFFPLQHSESLILDKFWCLFLFKELDFKNSHQCPVIFCSKPVKIQNMEDYRDSKDQLR